MLLANAQFVISQEPAPIDRARRALERRIVAATPAIAWSSRTGRGRSDSCPSQLHLAANSLPRPRLWTEAAEVDQ